MGESGSRGDCVTTAGKMLLRPGLKEFSRA